MSPKGREVCAYKSTSQALGNSTEQHKHSRTRRSQAKHGLGVTLSGKGSEP